MEMSPGWRSVMAKSGWGAAGARRRQNWPYTRCVKFQSRSLSCLCRQIAAIRIRSGGSRILGQRIYDSSIDWQLIDPGAVVERESPMKQREGLRPIMGFVLTMLFLNACSISAEVLSTATSSPPTVTSIPPTATAVPPTDIPPSPTPASPVITVDTIGRLAVFMSFGEGEVLRSVAFSPDNTVLASVAGNTEDFALRLWEVASGQSLGPLGGH